MKDKKEVNQESFIPILYVYLYRNLLNCHGCRSISFGDTKKNYRWTIHHAPAIVYRRITEDLERLGFVKIINRKFVFIVKNDKNMKEINRLSDYIFPISPDN